MIKLKFVCIAYLIAIARSRMKRNESYGAHRCGESPYYPSKFVGIDDFTLQWLILEGKKDVQDCLPNQDADKFQNYFMNYI